MSASTSLTVATVLPSGSRRGAEARYRQQDVRTPLTASAGRNAVRWALIAGTLPSGLALNPATGVVSGTPTTSFSARPRVPVTDGFGGVAEKTLRLAID